MSATLPLIRAVVAALEADATLAGLGSPALAARIYSGPPQGVVFPYLAVWSPSRQPWEADGWTGAETVIEVDAWSRAGGPIEAQEIADRVAAVLHRATLTVDGQALVYLVHDFTRALADPDGQTTRAAAQFTAVTHPAD